MRVSHLLMSLGMVLSLGVSVSTLAMAQDAQPASSSTIKIFSESQKVPAGTMLSITFNTPMDARISQQGEAFTAYLQNDFYAPSSDGAPPRVILPKGTVVRGRIEDVQKPRFFSKGGTILLSFDHVVAPSGSLLPLDLNLSAENDIVKRVSITRDNGQPEAQYGLYTDPGVGYKIHKGFESGVDTLGKFTKAGVDAGKDVAGGAGMIVTVPATAIGGAVAGTAVTAGKSIKALVGRGESVVIEPGDMVNIDFGGSFTLPTE